MNERYQQWWEAKEQAATRCMEEDGATDDIPIVYHKCVIAVSRLLFVAQHVGSSFANDTAQDIVNELGDDFNNGLVRLAEEVTGLKR